MQPRIKMGLSVGAIGLALNVCVAGFIGLCGPIISLLAGGAAGYFAVQQEKPSTKNEGAKAGAMAGGIAGALVIIGQVIGGVGALAIMQVSGTQLPFGEVPALSGDPSGMIGYYLGGLGTGICLGIVGAVLAAGVGAGVGYMSTQEQAPTSAPME
ncbi:MAG: hypothetical protein H7Y59_00875 [Anaerolineales bacterium]|nr:hypothetical protein [Anaerolineales bacterium]